MDDRANSLEIRPTNLRPCVNAAAGMKINLSPLAVPRIKALKDGADEWVLLLQIDTDDALNMMWEDGGLLYFWVRRRDALRGDFSNAWMILQSG
jgi:uncharacterized protein YwqG